MIYIFFYSQFSITHQHSAKCYLFNIHLQSSNKLHHVEFKSQVFSLGLSPIYGIHGRRPSLAAASAPVTSSPVGAVEDVISSSATDAIFYGSQWLAVGLESSEVEVVAIGPDGPPTTTGNGGNASPLLKPLASPQGGAASSPQASTTASAYDQHFRLTRHESCVLALRFAHHADWFITTGKDHQVNAWRTPYGACLLEVKCPL